MNNFHFILALAIIFLLQTSVEKKHSAGSLSTTKVFKLDPVKTNLSKNTDSLAFLISNDNLNTVEALKNLEQLSPSPERSYLISLLYKRAGNYPVMYYTLIHGLKLTPSFIEYYGELSFAAKAMGRNSKIEKYLSDNYIKNIFKNYILGLIRSSENKHKEALELLLAAAKYDSTNPNILFEIANEYKNLGDYNKSFDYLIKCEQANKNVKHFAARILIARGTLFFLSGNYDKANKYYFQAEAISRSSNDWQSLTNALVDLGIIADMDGNTDEARKLYNEARDIAEGINYTEGQAFACSELGVSYSFTNQLVEAKHCYVKSFDLYKIIGNRLRLSLLSDNIGKVYMAMFDFRSAQKYYEEGLQYAGDNNRAQVLNLIGLADIYTNLANYGKALEYYKKAEKLSSEVKELSLDAEIYNGLGVINYNLRNYKNALKLFSSSEELVSTGKENLYLQADFIYKCALSFMELDSLTKAEEYLNWSILLSKKINDTFLEANILTEASLLQFKKGNNSQAFSLLKDAKSLSVKNDYKIVLARIYLLSGDYSASFAEAKGNYENSLRVSKELNNFDLVIDSYSSLGKLSNKYNLTELTSGYYESAISLMEDVGRPLFTTDEVQIKYFSSKQDVYKDYAELLIKNNQYEKAFLMLDRSKSRNMMQNLNNLKLQSFVKDDKLLDQLYEYEWMIHSGLYAFELDSLKNVYAVFKKELAAKDPHISRYLNFNQDKSVKDYQKSLTPNESALSFYVANDYTALFLISKSGFNTYIINNGRKQVSELLRGISPYYSIDNINDNTFFNQDLFSFNAAGANNFYNSFLKEALTKVPKNSKLIIIPSVETVYLPFEILVTNSNKEESPYVYRNKKYLLMDYDISYSPSLGAYIDQKGNDLHNGNKFLIMGDPAMNTNSSGYAERRGLLEDEPGLPRNISLLPLRYSREEVNEIGNLINADQVLTDRNATETNFKNNAALNSIIHLSTHSFLIKKQPVIFLSNIYDPENDGFLEASEIAGMNLNSDLVVLSSCKSGLGEIDESEGVLGMTKAFFEAGTKSVVVSLWEVNDRYTSNLMTLFYEKLSKGFDKGEALREAKMEFIKKYSPNPYYWGAFVLSGNTGSLVIKQAAGNSWYWLLLVIPLFAVIYYYKRRSNLISS